jgi:hypothetical protein
MGAAVATVAAVVLAGREAPRSRRFALVAGGALVMAAVANGRWGFYDVRMIKGVRQPEMLALRWNSFSRVEVIGTPAELWQGRPLVFHGYSTTLDPELRIPEVWLRYDAVAATQITRFDGDPSRLWHLRYDVTSAAYQMRRYRNVLVIGPGGGRDILTALHLGSGPVTGVEINPLTIQLLRRRFRTFTGGLYDGFPGVRIVNDEGRNFVRHANEQYDLIQASLVDTWAASAAGAHALTENYLYTVEAFEDYLRHLTPDGVVSFSRWFSDLPAESLRVVALAVEALRRQGVTDAAAHVLVVRTNEAETRMPSLCTILLKRSPFTADELAELRGWATRMRFLISCAPDDLSRGAPPGEFHQLLGPQAAPFIACYPADISPVYDDRPFFFNRVPLIAWLAHRLGLADSPVGERPLTVGGQTLLISLVAAAASTALLLLIPLAAARWRRGEEHAGRTGRKRGALWALYFAGLGLGFIMVEVVLIQRFSLFLGYPVYALSVVLFTTLLASGIGSLIAGRWSQPPVLAKRLPRILAWLCGMLALYALALPRLLDLVLGAPTLVRISVAVAVIAPLGLLMGMPFPTGLRRAAREAEGLVSWAWAVNGGASVLGSTLAVLISMTSGFTAALLAGVASYAVALGVAVWALRPGTADGETAETERPQRWRDRRDGETAETQSLPVSPSLRLSLSPSLRGWLLVAALLLLGACQRADDTDLLPPPGYSTPGQIALTGDSDARFAGGWYQVETGAEGATWRWMGKRGEIRLRNQGAEMRLRLRGWAPLELLPAAPTLRISINGQELDRFTAPAGHFTKEYTVPRAVQGGGETSSLVIESSATVTPPKDDRQLGYSLTQLVWEPLAAKP